MKKLAVFVEGYTEMTFMEGLVKEVAGQANVAVSKLKYRGPKGARTLTYLTGDSTKEDDPRKFYVQIRDCSGDGTVKSDVQENYDRLAKDFSGVIALRDLYPQTDLPKLRRGLELYVKTKPLAVKFVVAVAETEAWFLAESSHFSRIHANLTKETVRNALGYHPDDVAIESIATPAKDLASAYSSVGELYVKRRDSISRTVNALDHAEVYVNLPLRIPSLRELTDYLDAFFT